MSVSDRTSGTRTQAIFGQDKTSGESQIAIGEQDTSDKALMIGYDHDDNYGYAQISGDSIGSCFNIADGGLVGVGTTSPGAKMEVKGSSDSTVLRVVDSDGIKMFEVVDDIDASSKDVTMYKSVDGDICVVPKAKTSGAIQECIDYLMNLSRDGYVDRGGTVYLPGGKYTLQDSVYIGEGQQVASGTKRKGHGIKIIGAGPEATILEIDNASAQVGIHIRGGQSGTTPHPSAHVVLKDFMIRPSETGDANHTGIYISYGSNCLIENIVIVGVEPDGDTIHRFAYGIKCESWCNTYINCDITYISNYGIYLGTNAVTQGQGTLTTEANQNSIIACSINMLGASGKGIYLVGDGNNSRYVQGCVISGCTLQNYDDTSDPYSGTGIHVANNDVKSCIITGLMNDN